MKTVKFLGLGSVPRKNEKYSLASALLLPNLNSDTYDVLHKKSLLFLRAICSGIKTQKSQSTGTHEASPGVKFSILN